MTRALAALALLVALTVGPAARAGCVIALGPSAGDGVAIDGGNKNVTVAGFATSPDLTVRVSDCRDLRLVGPLVDPAPRLPASGRVRVTPDAVTSGAP